MSSWGTSKCLETGQVMKGNGNGLSEPMAKWSEWRVKSK